MVAAAAAGAVTAHSQAPPPPPSARAGAAATGAASRRRQRWRAMMQPGIHSYMAEHRDEFRRHVARGIPTECRWEVWKAAAGVEARIRPGLYQELLQVDSKWARLVEIDVSRTFPDLDLFDGDQQQSLLRILRAYAAFNHEVGYCQGMNFVAGLLMYVCQNEDFRETPRLEKEEDVFWLFVCLMEDRRLSGFYKRRFPLLRRYLWAFDELAAVAIPGLRDHFQREGVQHAVYLHQWFLTLFINCLPLPMVLVFWDVLVCGGLDLLLPITVALLQILEETLMTLQFEDILRFFKSMRVEDPSCDPASVARGVIMRSAEICIPGHVEARLEEETGALADGPEGDCSPLADRNEYPQVAAAAAAAQETTTGGAGLGFQLAASYLGRFAPTAPTTLGLSDLGLTRGVLSWWEDARENLQRAGLASTQGI